MNGTDAERILFSIFTDPMMGLSYESEPVFRKLETHFPGRIVFRHVMSLLVPDVFALVDPADLPEGEATAIERYNARLAKIYESEEAIGGLPINMIGFCLFSPERPSSLPLNVAYKTAQLVAPKKADAYLYRLRFATIAECRPTTRKEELVAVARETGIDADAFLKAYDGPTARRALNADLSMARGYGIRSLPACLLEYRGQKIVASAMIGYDAFAELIEKISGGNLKPTPPAATIDALKNLLREHPLISPQEIREAFGFQTTEEAQNFIRPLTESGEAAVRRVPRGWFLEAAKEKF